MGRRSRDVGNSHRDKLSDSCQDTDKRIVGTPGCDSEVSANSERSLEAKFGGVCLPVVGLLWGGATVPPASPALQAALIKLIVGKLLWEEPSLLHSRGARKDASESSFCPSRCFLSRRWS